MGRSVEYVDNPIYFDASDEYDEDGFYWDDLIINLQHGIRARFKSFEFSEDFTPYPYRENRIILKNDFVCVSISEYCGCGAVSVYLNPNCEIHELAEYWITKSYYPEIRRIVKDFTTVLSRIGTFSNGVGVFEKAEK